MNDERAAHAAAVIAEAFGLDARDPEVIASSNNTIVVLPRAQAVAKVGVSSAAPTLGREIAVARHLTELRAPIVPPLGGELGGPHGRNGFALTLWWFCPTTDRPKKGAAVAVAEALAEVHHALAAYRGELPALEENLARAGALVRDKNATPRLSDDDRRTLLAAYEAGSAGLKETASARPIHGEPHDGNVLWTSDGPRLIDFEATCRGPLEWDVAHQPREGRAVFSDARPDLVEHCQLLVSFAVAAWCWAKPESSPTVAEAARVHLEHVRRALGA